MAENPCARVVRTSDDGARVQGCAHGGHLTGWWPVGARESRLWMSSASGCGPGIAIRGGIPVVFPQFGAQGELPKHGFARDRAWRRLEPPRSHNASMGFATTIENEPGWPHRAGLQLSATARGDRLAVTLQVTNVGAEPFVFTAALHAYLAVGSTADTVIEGLSGLAGVDAAGGGRAVTLPDGPLPAAGPQDLMIREVPAPLTLRDPTRPDLRLQASGFRDWVVWNPGPGHALPDVPPGDESGFVCAEPAVLDPVPLAADRTWAATLTMTATV